jgi:Putative threonine/serine exporter
MAQRRDPWTPPSWLPPLNTVDTRYDGPLAPGVVSTLLHIRRPPISRDLSFRTSYEGNPRISPSLDDSDDDEAQDDEFDVPEPEKTFHTQNGVGEDYDLNGESTRPEDNEKKRGMFARKARRVEIVQHVEGSCFSRLRRSVSYLSSSVLEIRKKFIRMLAKALMSFGAPSHRIESQLDAAAKILVVNAAFVHLPAVIIISFGDKGTKTSEMHFVRAGGRIALSMLHIVHDVYRDVLHDRMGAEDGMNILEEIMDRRPVYNIWVRCILSFFCSSIICTLAFGGSILDMFIGGAFACALQYLGLNAASRSSIYANVYE